MIFDEAPPRKIKYVNYTAIKREAPQWDAINLIAQKDLEIIALKKEIRKLKRKLK